MNNSFSNQVVSVRSIHKTDGGKLLAEQLYGERTNRKKSKRGLGLADKLTRRWVRATATGATELAERHGRSEAKKRSGGVRDLGKNVMKASRKASKKFRIL